ncbi:hypothetical protein AMTR_s00180p00022660 [Amborella trichopoda]|uniref:Uncharacterized protein n=1 Tax=Amborella trichopoda TaxID=13333 RepID=W1PY20_AMBTC|nr:hypothetical protein AMTR_s00180p00022660 [Amborella trichopoda]
MKKVFLAYVILPQTGLDMSSFEDSRVLRLILFRHGNSHMQMTIIRFDFRQDSQTLAKIPTSFEIPSNDRGKGAKRKYSHQETQRGLLRPKVVRNECQ